MTDTTREDRRRPARLRVRRQRIGAASVALVLVFGALGTWLARAEDGKLPPGVAVEGVDVGGRTDVEARALIEERVGELRRRPIRLTAREDPGFRLDVPIGSIAGRPLVDRALREARDARGAGSRLLARLGISGDREIPLRFALKRQSLDALVVRLRQEFDTAAVPARVRVGAAEITVVPSKTGRRVDRRKLSDSLQELPEEVVVPIVRAAPAVSDTEASAARDEAQRIVEAPYRVRRGQNSATLTTGTIRRALRFPVKDGRMEVALDADVLRRALAVRLGAEQTPPRDATFQVNGDAVTVVPGVPGRLLDTEAVSAAIVANPDVRDVAAEVRTKPPDRTTAEARALGIRVKVSEFTTPYSCCPPRVTNIRRAAETIDGTIIPAGGRFSLNEALGRRTEDKGYVAAPQIENGRLVDAVGGGVSQVATIMYNAAFFAGLELVAHTPHQFYISRYPMGREATVSWGGPELVFRNDWDAAILVKVFAGNEGITVRFYSSDLGRRVETETGTPRPGRDPKTIEVKKPDLPPGTRNVVQQAGAGGFSISYTRKVYEGNRLRRDETFSWSYSAEDAVVEVGPPKKPGDKNDPPSDPKPGDEPTTTTSPPPPASPPPSPMPARPSPTPLPGG